MNIYKAVTNIRHDGKRYFPGDELPELTTEQKARLLNGGHIKIVSEPDNKTGATGSQVSKPITGVHVNKSAGSNEQTDAGNKPNANASAPKNNQEKTVKKTAVKKTNKKRSTKKK